MEEARIELTKLVFEWEPDHPEDEVRIYTHMGIHKTGVPMGHKCHVGGLSCSDTTDPEDAKYQIANLFCAAPDMLEVLKSLENDDGSIPDRIWQMRNNAIRDAEAIPEDV